MTQKVLRGRDSLTKIEDMLGKLNIKRPMLVTSDGLAATLYGKAETAKEWTLFSAFHANPDFKDCAAGVTLYRDKNCDGLVSLGGGSAMDTAKGIKALLLSKDDDAALHAQLDAGDLPHLAIPGTAGTGAEATQFAVMYVDAKKYSLSNPALRPDGVILDSSLLDTLPDYHRKSCAMDALCQGIESYWAKGGNEDSQVNAFLAVLGVLDNLKAYIAGDRHAATEMMEAAYRSGCAINVSRTTAAHAMSYRLTKLYGIAHGHACMLTLPTLWEHMLNDTDVLPTLMDLSAKMRLGSELMVPRFLTGILLDMGLSVPPMPDEATLDALADSVNVERLNNHPQALTREDVKAVYRKAFTPLCDAEKQACLDIWRYYGQD